MTVSAGLAGHSAGSIVRRFTTPKGPAVMQGQVDLVKGEKISIEIIVNSPHAVLITYDTFEPT